MTKEKLARKTIGEEAEESLFFHYLVPKHDLLSKEEAEKVLKEFGASPRQFPFLLASDPAAIEIGAKPGDVVRITRRSETAGSSVYYRFVVEG